VTSLVELRILEGPNLYFPRAAVKLTLDVSGLAAGSEQDLRAFGVALGMTGVRPGRADSGFRQRAVMRLVERVPVRRLRRGNDLSAAERTCELVATDLDSLSAR